VLRRYHSRNPSDSSPRMEAVIVIALLIAGCNGALYGEINKQIVSGTETGECEFPHMVFLRMDMLGSGIKECGGALLDSVHILTAAHCINNVLGITAHLGNANYQKATQVIKANRWVSHDEYMAGHSVLNDVGMVHLEKPVTLGECIKTIKLPKKDQVFTGTCIAAGWGAVRSKGSGSIHLRSTPINIIPVRECQKHYYGISPQQHICVGDRTNMGANFCSSDSGSPLMCQSGNENVVAGVASYNFNCDNGFGVYANVAGLLDWVVETQKEL